MKLICHFTIGWEQGTQYEYKYIGRSAAGIYTLKQQNAVIELQSRVIVQSIDENTIVVKVIFLIKIYFFFSSIDMF